MAGPVVAAAVVLDIDNLPNGLDDSKRLTAVKREALYETILEKADVVVEAGSFYGAAGEGHLRVCFGSQSAARVAEAMDRLQHFFGSL